ncbi:box C/D snoRNA protein 1 [Suncus etruscus]|uniref:box C/D snoRNA protein 1 n=1 Tax=Suncus etruscus TaxID=109475 RepID=UPI00210FE8BE|nr:box C/D snoRNA protein 1 [Suncus etruscus]
MWIEKEPSFGVKEDRTAGRRSLQLRLLAQHVERCQVLREVHSFLTEDCNLKDSGRIRCDRMDHVTKNEEALGKASYAGAEGTWISPESHGEVRDAAFLELAGHGGAPGDARSGIEDAPGDGDSEGGGQKAEEITVDLTIVKQEVTDWPEMEAGQGVKLEMEAMEKQDTWGEAMREMNVAVKEEQADEREVEEEKVKVEAEARVWGDAKLEETKEKLEIKQEEMPGHGDLEEPQLEEASGEAQLAFPEEEMVQDAKGVKRKLAMSRCETCGTEEAKYRCPRCLRYSCSLPCVKKHKAELTCNGIREKTAYVSIQQFTEMNLLSDYRFLEDVARTADHISRDAFLKKPISNKHMYFLKNRARKQGINLKLLPNGFTKRRENSTFFDKKKQQFCWHVKLQFPQSQAVYIEKRVPDDKTINEILRPYIDPEKSDPVIRQRLKAYFRSQSGVQILMKVEYVQQNSVSYYELDPYKSLLDNLKNKVIIEYPTLHMVLKEFSSDMKILNQGKSESVRNIGGEN